MSTQGTSRVVSVTAAFALLWGLGLWPHFVPIAFAVPGGLLFFVAAHVVSRRLGFGGLSGLGLSRRRFAVLDLGVGFVVGFSAIGMYVVAALIFGRWQSVTARPLGEMWGLLLTTALTTAYIGFWEETLCRGFLLRAVGSDRAVSVLALISGAAFVAFHFTKFASVPGLYAPYWFLSGIAYALPVLLTGSLWISAGMHWGHNLFFALFLTREGWLLAERAGTMHPLGEYLLLLPPLAMMGLGWLLGRLVRRSR